MGLSSTKVISASGAVLPKQLDTLKNVIVENGATLAVLNFRSGSSATGPILLNLSGSAANATDQVALYGIKFSGGLYVEIVSGGGQITLEME